MTKSSLFDGKMGGVKDLLVCYSNSNEFLKGIPTQIAKYQVARGQLDPSLKSKNFQLEIKFLNNVHNIPIAFETNLLQENAGEGNKLRKKASKVDFKLLGSYQYTKSQMQEAQNIENQAFREDSNILVNKQLKNDLEAYSYEIKDKLGPYGQFEKYLEPSQRQQAITLSQQIIDNLYNEEMNF
mmetsp:Transcript_18144/g.31005  ORF Transcript_18144/g.31005 Transcript_18144/m.31005 type:complete len:183 (+) Transcript_18144:1318-1866(+)